MLFLTISISKPFATFAAQVVATSTFRFSIHNFSIHNFFNSFYFVFNFLETLRSSTISTVCGSVMVVSAMFTASCQPDSNNNVTPTPTTCGRIARLRQGAVNAQTFTYDAQGKIKKVVLLKADGTLLRAYRLTRDAANNITTNVDSSAAGKDVTTVQYDANNRATGGLFTRYNTSGTVTNTSEVTYRYTNNRLTTLLHTPVGGGFAGADSTVYAYNAAGKLTNAKAYTTIIGTVFLNSELTYTYNADNNLSNVTGTGGTFTYTYDATKPADLPFVYDGGRSLLFYNSLANDDMLYSKRITQYAQGGTTYTTTYTNDGNGCVSGITTAGGGSSVVYTVER